jgi:hypothetical protein
MLTLTRESSWHVKRTRDFFLRRSVVQSREAFSLLTGWGVRVALLFSFFAECGSLGGGCRQKLANVATFS